MWGPVRSAGIWGNRGNGSTSNKKTTITNCFALYKSTNNTGRSWFPIAYRHTANEKLTGSNNYYMQLDMSFDGYSGIAGLQEGLGRTNVTGGWTQGTNESEAGGGATTDVKAHRLYAGVDSGANAAQDGDNFYHFFAMLPKMLVVTDFSMTSALSQPIIDYKNHTINLDTVSCRQTLAYEKEFRTGEISYEMQNGLFDSFNPEVVQDYFANGEPFASLDPSYMTVGLLRQCAALGIKTVTLPIPNELGGVTAEIGSYAIGNRNTKHPAEVKALLAYLLSEECQSSSAFADKDMFPVRRGCLKKCMEAQYQFSVYDASHEKIGQGDIEKRKEMYGENLTDAQLDQLETICDKINAAQYHTIWYRALQLDQSEDGGNLLSETMVQYWNDEITLDELVDRLTPRLKLYLDE